MGELSMQGLAGTGRQQDPEKASASPLLFVDTPSYFIRPRNTDWRYLRGLFRLEEFGGPQTLYTVDPAQIVLESAIYIQNRLGLKILDPVRILNADRLRHLGATAVLNHSIPPKQVGERLPVIWRHEVLDEEMLRRAGIGDATIHKARDFMKKCLDRVDHVITATSLACERNKAIFPDHAEKFVPLSFFLPNIRTIAQDALSRKLQVDLPRVQVLFVGRDSRRKGLDIVFSAWERLAPETQKRAVLNVVTDALPAGMRCPEGVNILGAVPHAEALALLQSADIFVMPSRIESFGFVFVEAMAAGCAVIAPPWESQQEILNHGKAGILCDPSAGTVAEGLETLICNDVQRRNLARAAVEQFSGRYCASVIAEGYKRLTQTAGNGGPRGE